MLEEAVYCLRSPHAWQNIFIDASDEDFVDSGCRPKPELARRLQKCNVPPGREAISESWAAVPYYLEVARFGGSPNGQLIDYVIYGAQDERLSFLNQSAGWSDQRRDELVDLTDRRHRLGLTSVTIMRRTPRKRL